MLMHSRRSFIQTTSVTAAGLALGGGAAAGLAPGEEAAVGLAPGEGTAASAVLEETEKGKRSIHAFTKCLQFLDYGEMADLLARNGFDGADLTVRPGGQVEPGNVEKDLPEAVHALQKAGIGTKMIVTGINSADHPDTRPILKTMSELGIPYYRMGYLGYDPGKTIPGNLEMYKRTFKNLEKLNRTYGVTADYQNHSGDRVGGPVWDLYHLLKECDPDHMGVQYDICHATIEGGKSWTLGMKLLAPWIHTTDIKDFVWKKDESGTWRVAFVPLGEGMVDFRHYFKLYKTLQIKGPVSMHFEYDLGGAEHGHREVTMSRARIESFMKRDLELLKDQI